ncbi:hypothetical protein NC652_029467 [Populus alba x Populus x berolinensis]|nr:hypothetical protein NC652_029459 [Populus alba x Populus x berolinensis]KAJ6888411.1 hypothetical protein NC652_029467 [Populus alba x Populus x berolinensis]
MVQPLKEKKRYLSRHGYEIPTMIPVIHGATQPLPPLRDAFFFSLLGFSFFFFFFFFFLQVRYQNVIPHPTLTRSL